jgi:AraC-like DNA-binding protein
MSLYRTWPQGDVGSFRARADGYRVGELVFNQARFTPARFLHDTEHLIGEGRDFLSLQEQLAGEERLIMRQGHVRLLPGHIYLRDWAYPFDSVSSAMRLNAIMIPRHRLRSAAGMHEHMPVLSWSVDEPDGHMLSLLWRELLTQLGQVSEPQAQGLCDAFLSFLDALLGYRGVEAGQASLGAMQQFIMTRLRGEVDAGTLCEHFHVSRSTVYRLFKPLGGVKQFINTARLDQCYSELRRADPGRVKIAEIAASWGFLDNSSFSRRFRNHFGVLPSEVLGSARNQAEAAAASDSSPEAEPRSEYTEWLREASGGRE